MKAKLYLAANKGGLTYVGEFIGPATAAQYVKEHVDLEHDAPILEIKGALFWYVDLPEGYMWEEPIPLKELVV